jgi:hypothetical protein
MRKRPKLSVRSEWMALYPQRRDMRFWLAVALRIKTRRIRHKDHAAIISLCHEVNTQVSQLKSGEIT